MTTLNRFHKNHFEVIHTIVFDGEYIGTISILSNLEELKARLNRYILIVLIVLSGSVLLIYILTARFQRTISRPILNLTHVASIVSSRQDYSIRAARETYDEIGILIDSFNHMVSQIQGRDEALGQARKELEEKAIQLQKELAIREEAQKKIGDSLKEKEVLLQEIHHRVKNNLQVISSLLYIQSRNLHDKSALASFQDCQNRVKTMALIHEQLYQSKDYSRVRFYDYLQNLSRYLYDTYHISRNDIDFQVGCRFRKTRVYFIDKRQWDRNPCTC